MLNFLHIRRGLFMIISHDFGIDLMEYAARGKENEYPLLDKCPNCKCIGPGNIHRNGYYWRFGLTDEETRKIPICRLRCLMCNKSISILPDFLIPYFQHTIHVPVFNLNTLWRWYLLTPTCKASCSNVIKFRYSRSITCLTENTISSSFD